MLDIRVKKKAHGAHQVINVNKCPQIFSLTIVSPVIAKQLVVAQGSAAIEIQAKCQTHFLKTKHGHDGYC